MKTWSNLEEEENEVKKDVLEHQLGGTEIERPVIDSIFQKLLDFLQVV